MNLVIRSSYAFVLGLACSMPAAAAPAGSTVGRLSVGPSGAATYSIPLRVPSATAGLGPALSLEYSSQSSVGIAGPGWNLKGVSFITRCPRTWTQDGTRAPVTLTTADRFCLDGERLVLADAGKPYGADGAEYRTERDSFARITSLGVAGSGPASFKVEAKSGLFSEYGATSDSRVLPGPSISGAAQPTTALLWAMNRVLDRDGNEMLVKWVTNPSTGSYLLDRIEYSGGKAFVQFSYEDDSVWKRVDYVGGSLSTQDKRLTTVASYVINAQGQQQLSKTYKLSYRATPTEDLGNRLGKLLSVQECGAQGGCLPAIGFDWGPASNLTVDTALSIPQPPDCPSITPPNWFPLWADLNKDGRPDMLCFMQYGVTAAMSRSDGSFQPPIAVSDQFADQPSAGGWTTQAGQPRYLIDMNRDGYPDIVGFHFDGAVVATWDPAAQKFGPAKLFPSRFGSRQGWYTGVLADDAKAPRFLIDMNRDGLPDIVGLSPDGNIYISYWDGSAFSTPQAAGRSIVAGVTRSEADIWRVGDMDGDGYQDIVHFTAQGVYISYWRASTGRFDDPVFAGLADFGGGSGQGGGSTGGWANLSNNPRYLVDMNGDGWPDIVGFWGADRGLKVSLWDGKRFLPPTFWDPPIRDCGGPCVSGSVTPPQVVDLNGDGFPDAWWFTRNSYSLSNGRDALLAPTSLLATGTQGLVIAFRDLDGDGVPEVMFAPAAAPQKWVKMRGALPLRIIRITDSLGARQDIRYGLAQPLSSVYSNDPSPSVWPVQDAHGPKVVVAQVLRDDGMGGQQSTTYRYGGLKVHRDYGLLGFRWMAMRDEGTGLETTTYFEQSYPFIGRPQTIEQRRTTASAGVTCPSDPDLLCFPQRTIINGLLLSRLTHVSVSENLGAAGEYAANQRRFLYSQKTIQEAWDLDGTALPTTTTLVEFEEPRQVVSKQWGNPTRTTVSTSDGLSTVTTNTYEAAAEPTWTLGRLKQTTTASTRPARTITVAAPANAAPTPQQAPISPAVLQAILSLLLND